MLNEMFMSVCLGFLRITGITDSQIRDNSKKYLAVI